MGFEKEHREFTLSAIFSVGIMLVGLDVVDSPEIDGEPLPITDVFVECINFEDFVLIRRQRSGTTGGLDSTAISTE